MHSSQSEGRLMLGKEVARCAGQIEKNGYETCTAVVPRCAWLPITWCEVADARLMV